MFRFRTIFPDGKPLIAMAHIPALPGTPLYGSSLKVDGYTWNPVDSERAKRFVDAARAA